MKADFGEGKCLSSYLNLAPKRISFLIFYVTESEKYNVCVTNL